MKCQYPKCKKEATHSLSMADPDAEKNYYCEEHCNIAEINTYMSFGRRNDNNN